MIPGQLPEVKMWPAAAKLQPASGLWDEVCLRQQDIPASLAERAEFERSMAGADREPSKATSMWAAVRGD
jgi:hypothetical protein